MCTTGVIPLASHAQPPAPITTALFDFPGALPGPSSAVSVGLALSDRWLGDEPAGNPAAAAHRTLLIAPTMVRVSRQDLAADNRHFDQQAAFVDVASASAGIGVGRFDVSGYCFHPVLRREANAFERGIDDGVTQPASIQSDASVHELRAGLGVSTALGALRVGIAGEWTRRKDLYHTHETSGAPSAGETSLEFSGDGIGFQSGVRYDRGESGRGAMTLGASVRYVPKLSLTGTQTTDTFLDTGTAAVSAARAAGWEGGLSVRYGLSPAFRVLAGVGGHTSEEWSGFGVTSGAGTEWALGGEFHDARDPWTFRFGLGRGQQNDVPESPAKAVGIGFGWRESWATIDVGVVRRALERSDHPTAFDDRFVGSLTIPL